MWNKIYFAVLALAGFVMCFVTFYAHGWLGSIGNPKDALEGFEYYAAFGSIFLAVSSLVLLVLANVILWNTRRGWALWTTLAYFAVFVILRAFWLEKARYNFQYPDSLFFTPALVGAIVVIAAGAVVFVNQLMNLRLNEKMYPPAETFEKVEEAENLEEAENEK
jgi:hypothetical protein